MSVSKDPKIWFAAAAALSAAAIAGIDPLADEKKQVGSDIDGRISQLEEQFKGIRGVIGADYVGRCLTGNQVAAFSEGKRDGSRILSNEQQLLVKLYDARRESAMGRYINISQKQYNTVTCVETNPKAGHRGLYADWHNVATVNLGNLDNGQPATAAQALGDRRLFNLALRTAYEEITHAWQGNTQQSIAPPFEAHPLHLMMWVLGVEAQAKLITFLALNEHRERGDAAPWNTAYSHVTDKAQMNALQKVLDANPGRKGTDLVREKPEAFCSVFKAFFTDPMPRSLYERYIAASVTRSTSPRPIDNETFIKERGAFPGVKANFLSACKVSINDPALVKFFDKDAEKAIRDGMARVGANPAKYGMGGGFWGRFKPWG